MRPMIYKTKDNQILSTGCELMDVTSLCRPDTSWVATDAQGHEHRWCLPNGSSAEHYNPSASYQVPSLLWVKDGEEYYEGDNEPHDVGHLECRACGEHVAPRYTADVAQQYTPGLRWFKIDGVGVSEGEYRAAVEEAQRQR